MIFDTRKHETVDRSQCQRLARQGQNKVPPCPAVGPAAAALYVLRPSCALTTCALPAIGAGQAKNLTCASRVLLAWEAPASRGSAPAIYSRRAFTTRAARTGGWDATRGRQAPLSLLRVWRLRGDQVRALLGSVLPLPDRELHPVRPQLAGRVVRLRGANRLAGEGPPSERGRRVPPGRRRIPADLRRLRPNLRPGHLR